MLLTPDVLYGLASSGVTGRKWLKRELNGDDIYIADPWMTKHGELGKDIGLTHRPADGGELTAQDGNTVIVFEGSIDYQIPVHNPQRGHTITVFQRIAEPKGIKIQDGY
jgi:hypothetical protein